MYAETGKWGSSKYVGVQDRTLKLYPDANTACKRPEYYYAEATGASHRADGWGVHMSVGDNSQTEGREGICNDKVPALTG